MLKRIGAEFKRKDRHFWITTPQIRGQVTVNARGLISNTPPAWQRFLRRPLSILTQYLKESGHVQIEELK